MRKLLPLALLFMSVSGMAAQSTSTQSDTPSRIIGPNGSSVSVFTITTKDVPMLHANNLRLESIEWNTTGYPMSTGETVEMCYRRAWGSGSGGCEPLTPNSSGIVTRFNSEVFYIGAGVNIRHVTTGGERNSRPAGQDIVKFNYRY